MMNSDDEITRPETLQSQNSLRSYNQGSLRKKNSMYFKPEYARKEADKTDNLRERVRDQMRSSQASLGRNSNKPVSKHTLTKRSVFGLGILERLNSMIDSAYLNLQADGIDEDKFIQLREKQAHDEETYWSLKTDPAYENFKKNCKVSAKEEFELFFSESEKEIDEIEKLLGVDQASLEKIQKKFIKEFSNQKTDPEEKNIKTEEAIVLSPTQAVQELEVPKVAESSMLIAPASTNLVSKQIGKFNTIATSRSSTQDASVRKIETVKALNKIELQKNI